MEVMSSTASVRTRTCFSHCSLKRSMFSWASLLCGFAAKANAALITCEDIKVHCILFQSQENKISQTLWLVEWLRFCLLCISWGHMIPYAPLKQLQRWKQRSIKQKALHMNGEAIHQKYRTRNTGTMGSNKHKLSLISSLCDSNSSQFLTFIFQAFSPHIHMYTCQVKNSQLELYANKADYTASVSLNVW